MSSTTVPLFELHYSRILEWLVLTNLVPAGAAKGSQSALGYVDIDVQFAKSHLKDVKGLPNELTELLQSEINYFDAKMILQYLERNDGSAHTSTVFGLMGTEAVKSWWKLLRSWEKDNLHVRHAANQLTKMLSNDLENMKRKLFSAEKSLRTLDNRLIELQRASSCYDLAYSKEWNEWKTGRDRISRRSSRRSSGDASSMAGVGGIAPTSRFEKIINELSSPQFARSMDYVFAFSTFSQQGSETVKKDYHSIYKCLRLLHGLQSPDGIQDTDGVSLDALLCGDDEFQQELVLELQGLKAFLEQKASCSGIVPGGGANAPGTPAGAGFHLRGDVVIGTTPLDQLNTVSGYISCVGSLVRMLKSARSRNTSVEDLEDRDRLERKLQMVQKLREKAVKLRAFFDEMKQNREDTADSIQRYCTELDECVDRIRHLKFNLETELSQLAGGARVNIVCE